MAAPIFQLTMRSGPNPGKVFPIEREETFLGRDLATDIPISDPEVSRRHARFMMQADSVLIEDLGSTNGTFLNGQRIVGPQQLRAGDVITFGENIVMVFEQTNYDPDATVVGLQADPTVQPVPRQQPPVAQYQSQPQPVPQPHAPSMPPQAAPESAAVAPKKKGMPTWLIVLLIAIVVIAFVIAVTLYFMPASWWCAITFNSLEGCPIVVP